MSIKKLTNEQELLNSMIANLKLSATKTTANSRVWFSMPINCEQDHGTIGDYNPKGSGV